MVSPQLKTGLATLALASVLPLAAQAVPIAPFNIISYTMMTGSNYAETWQTGGDTWDIDGFSFTLNSTEGATDLALVTIAFSGGAPSLFYTFDDFTIDTAFGLTNATLLAPGFSTDNDFIITLSYATGGQQPIAANYVFTASVAEVPLPAAGGLLLAALGAAGAISRRRKMVAVA